jgi:hypothetical protein
MWSVGDYPLFTASGLPVEMLAWCAWRLRHAAAMSPDRSYVLHVVKESQTDELDADRLQTDAGRFALSTYFRRAWQWASVTPGSEQLDMTSDQLSTLFAPGQPIGTS